MLTVNHGHYSFISGDYFFKTNGSSYKVLIANKFYSGDIACEAFNIHNFISLVATLPEAELKSGKIVMKPDWIRKRALN